MNSSHTTALIRRAGLGDTSEPVAVLTNEAIIGTQNTPIDAQFAGRALAHLSEGEIQDYISGKKKLRKHSFYNIKDVGGKQIVSMFEENDVRKLCVTNMPGSIVPVKQTFFLTSIRLTHALNVSQKELYELAYDSLYLALLQNSEFTLQIENDIFTENAPMSLFNMKHNCIFTVKFSSWIFWSLIAIFLQ